MGHHDHHHHHHHFEESREGNKKGLLIALTITTSMMILEFFGGLITNSLALLSDSGHMLSDMSSLILSLVAISFATKPPSPNKTYGYYRFEILAALFNGLTLFIIAAFIVWEAIERFSNPPSVQSGIMVLIALIGLMANLLSAWALHRKSDVHHNVNIKSAYLHVISDALGSIGAIVAGLVMYYFNWYYADPLISVLVALLILKSAWGVLSHSIHILMEGTPVTIDRNEVKSSLESIEGVIDVHDLHIWTITSGLDSLSCHLVVDNDCDCQKILQKAIHLIEDKFQILHTTIQVEKPDIHHGEMKI